MTKARVACGVLVLALCAARPVLAGAPLICFPFDIQGARSLPFGADGFHDFDRSYDTSRLVADTVALLTPGTPVIVRMETLRRATIYVQQKPALGPVLLAALEQRARSAGPDLAALADFDLGYAIETFRQANPTLRNIATARAADGYPLVLKALALHPDPEINFAAAIISGWPRRADHLDHVRKALSTGADSLLAANVASHGLTQ